ncbi:MAG: polysaccharide pyruvyl transferase family protein [Clostridia bacterium]|nr:polysaccharide pyruvyl transferase family protein [Clostridia bacterium]
MKKVGILTINDNNNYGNRLQNYAISIVLTNLQCKPITIKNCPLINKKDKLYVLRLLKFYIERIRNKRNNNMRLSYFEDFNRNIKFTKRNITPYSNISYKYDYVIVGSDQVWNPNFNRFRDVDLLTFANDNQKVAFSASFGVNQLPEHLKDYAKNNLKTFKEISVREDAGKKIVEELTGRLDVEVLVDPTMLLSAEEWNKVSKRPQQLKKEKYILNYFLGEIKEEWKLQIDRIAKENNCQIINILDKQSLFYKTGPSEFLYLEKNAFMVCTDSFHSSVFSIIYNTPFIVFDRHQKGVVSMNSRIDTLLSKFKLESRRFKGEITTDLLQCDYTEAKKILEKEKEKSINFLKRALEIQE